MKILFLFRKKASFIQTDIDILRTKHEVRTLQVNYGWRSLPSTFRNYVNGTLWADVLFSWFGSHHAVFPFLFASGMNKPCITVASGFDTANAPEIQYGDMRPGWRRPLGIAVYKMSQRILAVSNFTASEIKKNIPIDQNKVTTIHHGFNVQSLPDLNNKKDIVLSIGGINKSNLIRKGIEIFVRSASFLPSVDFKLIGCWEDDAINDLKSFAPSNVQFTGYLENISHYLSISKVYAQPSYHEAFGCSVAEAMLQRCIPVVTNRASLPEVVGDTGFYVPYDNPQKIAMGIREAINSGPKERERARQRIIDEFPIEKRSRHILRIIDEL